MKPFIQNSADAHHHFAAIDWPEEVESLALLAVDQENAPLWSDFVVRGERDGLAAQVRKIARFALDANAAALVIAHNHPGGDASPSPDDIRATRMIALWLRPLGVELVDHLILTQDSYVSLRDHGVI